MSDIPTQIDELSQLERDYMTENARLRQWVQDLQSGMYVNCVYCGHRYGPGETTPVSMADALKAHVEKCPEHPMSALKAECERLHRLNLELAERVTAQTELLARRAEKPADATSGERGSCPCLYTTPCTPRCTCVNPYSSHGCLRCCAYGSAEQRGAAAERLAALPVERDKLRTAFILFIGHVLTVRSDNTPEWMEYIAERIDEAAAAIGEKDRVRVKERAYPHLPMELEIVRADPC